MVSSEIAYAIANIAIFFEFSSEDTLDEDASVQAMEQLAADLQSLSDDDREELSSNFRAIAHRYEGEACDFVKSLPELLGL